MRRLLTQSPTIIIRACRRCGGDLYRDMLETDDEFVCLQCGLRTYRSQLPEEIIQRSEDQLASTRSR